MNKLRTQAVIAVCAFLLLVLGGTGIFYFSFVQNYYISQKKELMEEVYQNLQDQALDQISYEEGSYISSLEEESFSIIICNSDFEQIYSSKMRDMDSKIQRKMLPEKSRFVKNATAVYEEGNNRPSIRLYGKIESGGDIFYIYIYENIYSLEKSTAYINNFLKVDLILAMVLGSIFAWIICSKIVKPVQNISQVAQKISDNDFSVRASESIPTYELNNLAKNINQMADKIQRDMNDLNNYNYILLRQNRNMAEFERMRKDLVNKMTHELKTPLAIISSQVEMLQYGYDDTKKDYYFSSIEEEIEKMNGLISNILHNSFTGEDSPSTLAAKDNLSALLETLIPKYRIWMQASDISFDASVQPKCMAVFDAMQIEQAVNNYVMNAVRHTMPKGHIRLTLRREPDALYCSVYNEGNPIPDDELERIWNSYYQPKESQDQGSSDGVGLGLFIVQDIIHLHHGTCGVFNCRQGVEFWFRLPKA